MLQITWANYSPATNYKKFPLLNALGIFGSKIFGVEEHFNAGSFRPF
jgi:hypothetical protein